MLNIIGELIGLVVIAAGAVLWFHLLKGFFKSLD